MIDLSRQWIKLSVDNLRATGELPVQKVQSERELPVASERLVGRPHQTRRAQRKIPDFFENGHFITWAIDPASA
jgi:hypothetical protein